MAEENKMAYFAPALIGAGLLASVFWFGKGERRLPREFGSLGAWPKGSRKNWNKNHKLAKGTSVRVYDNGGETTDRYTVVMVGKKWDGLLYPGEKTALGMDEGGLSFSQWTGVHEGKHLGRRVKWEDLPRATRGHIERRVLQD